MRRLMTLAVVAAALAGCSAGGETGPAGAAGTQGPQGIQGPQGAQGPAGPGVTIVTASGSGGTLGTGATVFTAATLRTPVLAVGQRVFVTSNVQFGSATVATCSFGVTMCFRAASSTLAPVNMPGWSTPCVSIPLANAFIPVSGSGYFTAPTAEAYDVGMCAFVSGTVSAFNATTQAMVFAP